MACGQKSKTNDSGVHLTERTCSPYNPIIKLMVDDCLGIPVYPVSSIDAIIDEDGNTLRSLLAEVNTIIMADNPNIDKLTLKILEINAALTTILENVESKAKASDLDKLKALIWLINRLGYFNSSDEVPNDLEVEINDNKYYPKIVSVINSLSSDIRDIQSQLGDDTPEGNSIYSRLQELSDQLNTCSTLLYKIANVNNDYSNSEPELEFTELNTEQIVQIIYEIHRIKNQLLNKKADLDSSLLEEGINKLDISQYPYTNLNFNFLIPGFLTEDCKIDFENHSAEINAYKADLGNYESEFVLQMKFNEPYYLAGYDISTGVQNKFDIYPIVWESNEVSTNKFRKPLYIKDDDNQYIPATRQTGNITEYAFAGDGVVNVDEIKALVSGIMSDDIGPYYIKTGLDSYTHLYDINEDNELSLSDINAVINYILNHNSITDTGNITSGMTVAVCAEWLIEVINAKYGKLITNEESYFNYMSLHIIILLNELPKYNGITYSYDVVSIGIDKSLLYTDRKLSNPNVYNYVNRKLQTINALNILSYDNDLNPINKSLTNSYTVDTPILTYTDVSTETSLDETNDVNTNITYEPGKVYYMPEYTTFYRLLLTGLPSDNLTYSPRMYDVADVAALVEAVMTENSYTKLKNGKNFENIFELTLSDILKTLKANFDIYYRFDSHYNNEDDVVTFDAPDQNDPNYDKAYKLYLIYTSLINILFAPNTSQNGSIFTSIADIKLLRGRHLYIYQAFTPVGTPITPPSLNENDYHLSNNLLDLVKDYIFYYDSSKDSPQKVALDKYEPDVRKLIYEGIYDFNNDGTLDVEDITLLVGHILDGASHPISETFEVLTNLTLNYCVGNNNNTCQWRNLLAPNEKTIGRLFYDDKNDYPIIIRNSENLDKPHVIEPLRPKLKLVGGYSEAYIKLLENNKLVSWVDLTNLIIEAIKNSELLENIISDNSFINAVAQAISANLNTEH